MALRPITGSGEGLTAGQKEILDSIAALSDGQVPKSDDSKFAYGGATVNETTGVWVFDKSIQVPSGSIILGEDGSVISSGLEVLGFEDVSGEKHYIHGVAYDNSGSETPRYWILSAAETTPLADVSTSTLTGSQSLSLTTTDDSMNIGFNFIPQSAGTLTLDIYQGTSSTGPTLVSTEYEVVAGDIGNVTYFDLPNDFLIEAGKDLYIVAGGVDFAGGLQTSGPFVGQTVPYVDLIESPALSENYASESYVNSAYTSGRSISVTGGEIGFEIAETNDGETLTVVNGIASGMDGQYTTNTNFSGTVTETTGLAVANSNYRNYYKDDDSGGYWTVCFYGDTPTSWQGIETNIDPSTWTDGNTTGTLGNPDYIVATGSETQSGQQVPIESSPYVSYGDLLDDPFIRFDASNNAYVPAINDDTMAARSTTDLPTQASAANYSDSVSIAKNNQRIDAETRSFTADNGGDIVLVSFDATIDDYLISTAVSVNEEGLILTGVRGDGAGGSIGTCRFSIDATDGATYSDDDGSGIKYTQDSDYENATDYSLLPKKEIEALATYTQSNGISISNQEVSIRRLSTSIPENSINLNGLTPALLDGDYIPSTFSGTLSNNLNTTDENLSYRILKHDNGDTTWNFIAYDAGTSAEWLAGQSNADPDTWVDGGSSSLNGSVSEAYLGIASQIVDSQFVVSDVNASVTYLEQTLGSFIEFNAEGEAYVSVLDEDDFASNSKTHVPTQASTEARIQSLIPDVSGFASIDLSSTRIISGSEISVNSGDSTLFDLAAGTAVAWDFADIANPLSYSYEWDAQSALVVTDLATEAKTSIAITHDNSVRSGITFNNSFIGTVNGVSAILYIAEKTASDSVFSPEERRIYPYIGRLTHFTNTLIFEANNLQGIGYSPYSFATELYRFIAPANFEGNEYSANDGTPTVQKSAGVLFAENANVTTNGNNPHFPDSAQVGVVNFLIRYYDASTGDIERGTTTTDFPFDIYNDVESTSNPLATVSNNSWVAHRIYLFADSNNTILQYGQATYSTLETAIEDFGNAAYVSDSDLETNATFQGWCVCRGGETTTDGGDWYYYAANGASASGGGSGSGLVSLQGAYDASNDKGEYPQIAVSDIADGAFTIQDAPTNILNDDIFRVNNFSGDSLIRIDRDLFTLDSYDSDASTFLFKTEISADSDKIELSHTLGDGTGGEIGSQGITVSDSLGMVITDNVNDFGIQYADDYSANFQLESLSSVRYVQSTSILFGDIALDGVSREFVGNNDADLFQVFHDTTSADFTKQGAMFFSDDEINFTYHDGDGAGAQTDSVSFTISSTGGALIADSKFNEGLKYQSSSDYSAATGLSVPPIDYINANYLSTTTTSDQTVESATSFNNAIAVNRNSIGGNLIDVLGNTGEDATIKVQAQSGTKSIIDLQSENSWEIISDWYDNTTHFGELIFELSTSGEEVLKLTDGEGALLGNDYSAVLQARSIVDYEYVSTNYVQLTSATLQTMAGGLQSTGMQSGGGVDVDDIRTREYYIQTGSAGGDFYLGNLQQNTDNDGGMSIVVHFDSDYSETGSKHELRCQLHQRNGNIEATWHTVGDYPSATDELHIVVIDDGVEDYKVWAMVPSFTRSKLDVVTRQGGSYPDSGTLAEGTITTGTTLVDTDSPSTSHITSGYLYGVRPFIQTTNGNDTSTNLNTAALTDIPIFNSTDLADDPNGDFTINSSTELQFNFDGLIQAGFTVNSLIADGDGRVTLNMRLNLDDTRVTPQALNYLRGENGCDENTNTIVPTYIQVTNGSILTLACIQGSDIANTATFDAQNDSYCVVTRIK